MNFNNDWQELFDTEIQKEYLNKINYFLAREYKTKKIYPPKEKIFNAFLTTSLKDTKVVILGQDPYHQPGQAQGFAFSVAPNVKIPPSLVNIYKEIEDEYHVKLHRNGDLTDWAKQGVLLLNPILTVEDSKPLSHQNIGWQNFTDAAIQRINEKEDAVVFLLWGSKAGAVRRFLNNPSHLVLTSSHPSPLSAYRGFFGNGHFKKCNEFLIAHGKEPIHWF
ncbi:uracil-DNA glycosylase [Faecalicoccus pleomorphus]|uniref:Uracil-DNA glycosylase n=1 Tax=Faecalicoccus pleomorphus TaxID=1323 RepID=A0A380LNK4_9FIRM|nr:uracil-DNA glycosylase [Faecalicoccus pleomorphus]SUO04823.1 uracil-DNA glycosylase [Faecalicoccus pleomorphus]